MRRLEEIFWPTKWQAIKRIVGWMTLTIGIPILCSATSGQNVWGDTWIFAVPAVYCALVLWYKVSRDQLAGKRAAAQRYVPPPTFESPRTTPGSAWMGVPSAPPED